MFSTSTLLLLQYNLEVAKTALHLGKRPHHRSKHIAMLAAEWKRNHSVTMRPILAFFLSPSRHDHTTERVQQKTNVSLNNVMYAKMDLCVTTKEIAAKLEVSMLFQREQ